MQDLFCPSGYLQKEHYPHKDAKDANGGNFKKKG